MITLSSQTDCFTSGSNIAVDSCSLDTGTKTLTYTYSTYTSGDISLSIKNFKNPVNRNTKTGFQIIHKDQGGNTVADSVATLALGTAMTTATTISGPTFTFGDGTVTT